SNYAQGRLTKIEENTDADVAAEVVHRYAYDHLGNVRVKQVSIEGLTGTKTAVYDHDLAGRVTRLVYPDGTQARYAYDGAGRLNRVGDANGNTLAAYTHTAAGNIATHVVGQGAGDTTADGVVTGTYTYNPREWVTDIDYAGTFSSKLTYDLAGNVTRQKYSHGNAASKTADYAYDNLYRITGFDLTGGTGRDYTYDRSGNLTSVVTGSSRLTYNYSGTSTPNRLDSTTGTGGQTYVYNQNGWMTRKGADTVRYDYRGLTTGYGTARYFMDPDRRRVKKTVGTDVTYYLRGPGGSVLAEYTGQSLSANYVYAGSRRIARISGDSASYYLADHLGSTRSLVDEAGSVTAAYDYWPYGKILSTSGSGATHFRFTGHERDSESSLDYMLNRNYDFNIGRFLRPDPMQDEYPGISPYAYAANNPLKYVDPDGRALVFGAIVGAAIDVGIQVAVDGRSLDEIDLGSVVISAAAGATGVGLITKLSKVNKVARFGIEAATDAGFSALHQVNETGNVDLTNTVQDVAVGRSIGRFAGETAGRIAGTSSTVRHLTRDADRLKRIGDNAASQGRDSRAKSRYTRAEELYEKAQNYIARRAISASTAATQIGSRIFGWFTSDGEEERDKE
ncbi:MAG: hypothetical protein OXI16_10220, partial [Chloroflexota bacterium]|nr:hypothetical protein [Chloroflexota bacterium]